MAPLRFAIVILSLISTTAVAHENEDARADDTPPPYTVTPIFRQAMSDPGLAGYEMLVSRLDIRPGGTDATPHRHDADLFVYVLEGTIEVELDGRKSTYDAGTMFHEPRNIVHSLLRNTNAEQPASILAVFAIKRGRESLVPVTD